MVRDLYSNSVKPFDNADIFIIMPISKVLQVPDNSSKSRSCIQRWEFDPSDSDARVSHSNLDPFLPRNFDGITYLLHNCI